MNRVVATITVRTPKGKELHGGAAWAALERVVKAKRK